MKKLLFFIAIISMFNLTATAQQGGDYNTNNTNQSNYFKTPKDSYIGLAVGTNNSLPFAADRDIYYKTIERKYRPTEYKIGINNNIQDYYIATETTRINSIGPFVDVSSYVLGNVLYVGLRWDIFNVNWADSESRKVLLEENKTLKPFVGTSWSLHIGASFKLSNRINLKTFIKGSLLYQNMKVFGYNITRLYNTDARYHVGFALEVKLNKH